VASHFLLVPVRELGALVDVVAGVDVGGALVEEEANSAELADVATTGREGARAATGASATSVEGGRYWGVSAVKRGGRMESGTVGFGFVQLLEEGRDAIANGWL
jgi:hypothetical protein